MNIKEVMEFVEVMKEEFGIDLLVVVVVVVLVVGGEVLVKFEFKVILKIDGG